MSLPESKASALPSGPTCVCVWFPILDFTEVAWLFSRAELETHLSHFPEDFRLSQLGLLRTRVGTRVVVSWPTEAPNGWLLARNTRTC